jgi:hypothetical protein
MEVTLNEEEIKLVLYSEKELSRLLNISLPKLRSDRVKGIGFPWRKIGKKSVRYPMHECLTYLQNQNGLSYKEQVLK